MALVAVEIPKVGLVMENARLVRWLKNVGDLVQQGEPLLELETEKSVVEIEATESGRLVEILLQVDQEAQVGDRIAWLDDDAVAMAPVPSVSGVTATASAPPVSPAATASRPVAPAASPVPASARRDEEQIAAAAMQGKLGRIRSSPVARRLAAEHVVDLRRIAGTGPRGRVQLIDVQRAIEAQSAPGAAGPAVSGTQPLSSMRRAAGALHDLEQCHGPAIRRRACRGLDCAAGGAREDCCGAAGGRAAPLGQRLSASGHRAHAAVFSGVECHVLGRCQFARRGPRAGERHAYRAGGRC